MANRSTKTMPELRKLEDPSSYPYVVGANLQFLKTLHDRMELYGSFNERSKKMLRADIAAYANDIRDHIDWLNESTRAREAAIEPRTAAGSLD